MISDEQSLKQPYLNIKFSHNLVVYFENLRSLVMSQVRREFTCSVYGILSIINYEAEGK